jgi:hypothetical protein
VHDAATRHVVTGALAAGTLPVVTERLRRALERFDDAAIATIHGFCARVLRERAFECGAELDGELLADADALCDELARDFWARESAARALDEVRALERACGWAVLRDVVGRALRHADAPCLPRGAGRRRARRGARPAAGRGAHARRVVARRHGRLGGRGHRRGGGRQAPERRDVEDHGRRPTTSPRGSPR